MSTRCYIGIENDDKTVDIVYCHHDGYPEHVGRILFENYNTIEAIKKLISYGDMSSLDTNIEGCLFYHRDRNESVDDTKAVRYENIKEIPKYTMDYIYIFKNDNVWYELNHDTNLSNLVDVDVNY